MDRAVEHLTAWPDTGTIPGVSANLSVRKMPVSRFPYYLAYVVAADAIRSWPLPTIADDLATGNRAPSRELCGGSSGVTVRRLGA